MAALYRSCTLLIFLLSLTGCSGNSSQIEKSSGGYLSSTSAVRFWRTDSPGSLTVIHTIINSINSPQSIQTSYLWKNHQLTRIMQRRIYPEPDTTVLRFDDAENLTYMQRQRKTAREALSAAEISNFRKQARSIYIASEKARTSGESLLNGVWLRGNNVMSCEKQIMTIPLSEQQRRQLTKLTETASPIYLSWTENNRDVQLLYRSPQDLCLALSNMANNDGLSE